MKLINNTFTVLSLITLTMAAYGPAEPETAPWPLKYQGTNSPP
ncbi:MAG: hypothetical protein ACLFWD_01845 [Anaerolineales bacterium]